MQRLLPLFPLTTSLVPGLVLPLHIFEPRYRELVATLLEEPDEDAREFGIIAVREGRDPHRDGMAALYDVGTTAVLRSAELLADGRYDIVTTGSRRFRVVDLDLSRPLAAAMVEYLDDVSSPADDASAGRARLAFRAYRTLLSGQVDGFNDGLGEPDDDDGLPGDPTVLSYLITAATVLPVAERQALLAAPTTRDRLDAAARILRREVGLLAALGALPAIDPLSAAPSAN